MQTTANWKQILGIGSVFMIAGGGGMAFNLLGSPSPMVGLFTFGLVLAATGLVARTQPA